MKISINGSIIETELIYEITDIKSNVHDWSSSTCHHFKIKMFNNVELVVRKQIIEGDPEKILKMYREYSKLKLDERSEYIRNSPSYQPNLEKLIQFRKEIIDIWSNNQSHIPQFNLEN